MKIKKILEVKKMNKQKVLLEDYFKNIIKTLNNTDSEFFDKLIETVGISEKEKNIIMSKKLSIYIILSYLKLTEDLIMKRKFLKNNILGKAVKKIVFVNDIRSIEMMEIVLILGELSKNTINNNANPATCSLIFMKNIKEIQELTDSEKERLYRFFLEFVQAIVQKIKDYLSTILITESIEEENNRNLFKYREQRETLSEETMIELSLKEGGITKKIITDKGILMYQIKESDRIICQNVALCCKAEFLIYKDSFIQIESSVIDSVKSIPNKIIFLESLIEKEELSLQSKKKMLDELKK
jgi:hypothetical protein